MPKESMKCFYCENEATTEVKASALKKKGVPRFHILHCDLLPCIKKAKAALENHAVMCR